MSASTQPDVLGPFPPGWLLNDDETLTIAGCRRDDMAARDVADT
jgi:hypothetical protein